MRYAHSWISLTDIVSRAVTFDLRFFKSEKTLSALVGRSSKQLPVLGTSDRSEMVIKFIRILSWIGY